jgi:hypothetical protein
MRRGITCPGAITHPAPISIPICSSRSGSLAAQLSRPTWSKASATTARCKISVWNSRCERCRTTASGVAEPKTNGGRFADLAELLLVDLLPQPPPPKPRYLRRLNLSLQQTKGGRPRAPKGLALHRLPRRTKTLCTRWPEDSTNENRNYPQDSGSHCLNGTDDVSDDVSDDWIAGKRHTSQRPQRSGAIEKAIRQREGPRYREARPAQPQRAAPLRSRHPTGPCLVL